MIHPRYDNKAALQGIEPLQRANTGSAKVALKSAPPVAIEAIDMDEKMYN